MMKKIIMMMFSILIIGLALPTNAAFAKNITWEEWEASGRKCHLTIDLNKHTIENYPNHNARAKEFGLKVDGHEVCNHVGSHNPDQGVTFSGSNNFRAKHGDVIDTNEGVFYITVIPKKDKPKKDKKPKEEKPKKEKPKKEQPKKDKKPKEEKPKKEQPRKDKSKEQPKTDPKPKPKEKKPTPKEREKSKEAEVVKDDNEDKKDEKVVEGKEEKNDNIDKKTNDKKESEFQGLTVTELRNQNADIVVEDDIYYAIGTDEEGEEVKQMITPHVAKSLGYKEVMAETTTLEEVENTDIAKGEEKKESRTWVVFIIIIATFAIAGGIYYIIKRKKG